MMVKDNLMSSNSGECFSQEKKYPKGLLLVSCDGRKVQAFIAAGRALEWREYAAGWGSGIVNIALTFPVNKTMFRQQLHGISAWDAASQLRAEGFLSLYRGILPPLLQKSATTALMFGSFQQYKRVFIEKQISGRVKPLSAEF